MYTEKHEIVSNVATICVNAFIIIIIVIIIITITNNTL